MLRPDVFEQTINTLNRELLTACSFSWWSSPAVFAARVRAINWLVRQKMNRISTWHLWSSQSSTLRSLIRHAMHCKRYGIWKQIRTLLLPAANKENLFKFIQSTLISHQVIKTSYAVRWITFRLHHADTYVSKHRH